MDERDRNILMRLWDYLFPPLRTADFESDDEIMIEPVIRSILDQDRVPPGE